MQIYIVHLACFTVTMLYIESHKQFELLAGRIYLTYNKNRPEQRVEF